MNSHYIKLSDSYISLEPLQKGHIEELKAICKDPEIWRFFSVDLSDSNDMAKWMKQRLAESGEGNKMTYAVRLRESNQVIGTSSYGRIDLVEKVIEIGWTWIGADFIGAGINKHMKFLMLSHAFETIRIERLELRTDEDNVRSRRAMEKIGAQHDGTLRSDRFKIDGGRRNSVVYSILREEWAGIRTSIFKNLLD